MKPFFKWSGGKSKELAEIKKFLPKEWETYYEPFLGGGALWLNLEPKKAVLGDNYKELVTFFSVLKAEPNKLKIKIEALSNDYAFKMKSVKTKEDQQKIADEFFYHWRDTDFSDAFDQAVRFYLIRQLCFSGMLRFSSKGKFNVPYGWYKSLSSISQKVEDIERVFQGVTILNEDWAKTVSTSSQNDFVFLDPPYTRKFQTYHPNGQFTQDDHKKLAVWFASKQAKAMIVLNKDDFTFSLYKDFIKKEYGKKYSIQYRDRMKEEDSNAVHFIATNYDV